MPQSYNGHISTHKPKSRRLLLYVITKPTCTCEIYERADRLFFTVRSREKLSTNYAAEAATDLGFVAIEVIDFRKAWAGRFKNMVKENA